VAWGDKTFYMDAGHFWNGMQALFWPTRSVIHVARFNQSPEQFFRGQRVQQLEVCAHRYQKIVNFIQQSFRTTKEGNLIPYQTGLYGASRFYAATDTYYFLYNCNNWTGRALRLAGYRTPLWCGLPYSAFLYLPEN
jgi:uncharacterized protein (TIGR02117 family)